MMLHALEKILDMDTSDSEKVETLRRAIGMMKQFETFAHDNREKGSVVELVHRFARQNGVDPRAVSDADVKAAIERGVKWLLGAQKPGRGGWGWPQEGRLRAELLASVKPGEPRSLPWDTAVAVLALHDWSVYSLDESAAARLAAPLRTAVTWLLKVQGTDGGWSALGDPDAPSHALPTGVVLWALRTDQLGVPKELIRHARRRAFDFFATLQNADGGAGAQPRTDSDTKATALSLLCHRTPAREGERLGDHQRAIIDRNGKWLLSNQGAAGGWGGIKDGQFIDPAFYAASALQMYPDKSRASDVAATIKRTIDWYTDHIRYVNVNDAAGWAWGDVPNTAAAVSTLLNNGVAPSSPAVQKGVEWLVRGSRSDCWKADTALAVIALIRYLKPGSRLGYRLEIGRV